MITIRSLTSEPRRSATSAVSRPAAARGRAGRDVGAAGDLLHVDAGARVEHGAALGQRDHRQGVRLAARGERRSLQRVDRDVDVRRAAVADLLAVVEHRRLVLLALADHDDAVHRHRVEREAHRVDGGLVGGLLVAAARPSAPRPARRPRSRARARARGCGRAGWCRAGRARSRSFVVLRRQRAGSEGYVNWPGGRRRDAATADLADRAARDDHQRAEQADEPADRRG